MKNIRLFNRVSVALGTLQLGAELALKSRVRLAEVDVTVNDTENWDNVACQTIEFCGFVHSGSAVHGFRDKASRFKASVLTVNVRQSWCVARLDFSVEMQEYRVHCEYSNCPSSLHLLYPSHLRVNREVDGSAWDTMDTDSCIITSLSPSTYEIEPHTPQIFCKNQCGRESPIHFFKMSEIYGHRSWVCQCVS